MEPDIESNPYMNINTWHESCIAEWGESLGFVSGFINGLYMEQGMPQGLEDHLHKIKQSFDSFVGINSHVQSLKDSERIRLNA